MHSSSRCSTSQHKSPASLWPLGSHGCHEMFLKAGDTVMTRRACHGCLGGMEFMLDVRQLRENVRRNGINLGFVLCTVDGSAAAWEGALSGTVLRSLLVGFLERLLGGPSCTHPATGHASACETHPGLCSRLHCSCHCSEDRDGARHIRHTRHSPKKHDPHTNSLHT